MFRCSLRAFMFASLLQFGAATAAQAGDSRPPILYQLFVRTFGNLNATRKPNGTLAENGVGKFQDINEAALRGISELGCDTIWLTGVLEQATGTEYPNVPSDSPELLKGRAGSPYAVKDYYDVCPDYAVDPGQRLAEFRALLERIHQAGMRAIIDFVPNHVARSYGSDVKPEEDFGVKDDRSRFFNPQNNFYYVMDGAGKPLPLRLPVGSEVGGFDRERNGARVTGNNVNSATPSRDDWYETIKLNYGFDFTDPAKSRREYPTAAHPEKPVPDTWLKMDRILAYWQQMGVDGFRCDMAHMVPPEFWKWAVARAHQRAAAENRPVLFVAEAYDSDPSRVPSSDTVSEDPKSPAMAALLRAGFDYVYDDPTYDVLKDIYDGRNWANDLDRIGISELVARQSIRYAENHDEIRIASRKEWGGIGMEVGRPVSAILLGGARGARMIYAGQEVGEPGAGAEGFGGDDGRTTIFDYWSCPELAKWVNNHQYDGGELDEPQRELRRFYGRLLRLMAEPAFARGEFLPLNGMNESNQGFGRLGAETASGHWLYGFVRRDPSSGQSFLCLVNLHRSKPLKEVRVKLPTRISAAYSKGAILNDRLSEGGQFIVSGAEMQRSEVTISEIQPLTALFFEMQPAQE